MAVFSSIERRKADHLVAKEFENLNITAPARDASTVMLLRDSAKGIEVFMVVRHQNIEFAPGALVFPGGSVDENDKDPRLRESVAPSALEAREFAWQVAAVREVYEESAVLLARDAGCKQLLGGSRLDAINRRFENELANHRLNIAELVFSEQLELAIDELVAFAHWVTPESRPKRFDTRFYLAAVPPRQQAIHDGRESVDSLWGAPAEIIAQAEQGRWQLRFPTRLNLEKLARSASVAAALETARLSNVVRILARAETVEGGSRVRIPLEAGYGMSEAILDAQGVLVSRR